MRPWEYGGILATVTELRGSSGNILGFEAHLDAERSRFFDDWRQAKSWCDAQVDLKFLAEMA